MLLFTLSSPNATSNWLLILLYSFVTWWKLPKLARIWVCPSPVGVGFYCLAVIFTSHFCYNFGSLCPFRLSMHSSSMRWHITCCMAHGLKNLEKQFSIMQGQCSSHTTSFWHRLFWGMQCQSRPWCTAAGAGFFVWGNWGNIERLFQSFFYMQEKFSFLCGCFIHSCLSLQKADSGILKYNRVQLIQMFRTFSWLKEIRDLCLTCNFSVQVKGAMEKNIKQHIYL